MNKKVLIGIIIAILIIAIAVAGIFIVRNNKQDTQDNELSAINDSANDNMLIEDKYMRRNDFSNYIELNNIGENIQTLSDTNNVNNNEIIINNNKLSTDYIETGSKENRGFVVDNVLHSKAQGHIHFSSYLPKDYNKDMIIISPQLDDWGEESANDTINLVEYFLENYNIDKSKVYISGVSGGGETLSVVLGKRPELFTAALYVSSKWDGNLEVLANSSDFNIKPKEDGIIKTDNIFLATYASFYNL